MRVLMIGVDQVVDEVYASIGKEVRFRGMLKDGFGYDYENSHL